MPATVLLNDIVEALSMQFDEYSAFLDLDSGQVENLPVDVLREAEEFEEGDGEPELLGLDKEQWETARRVVSTDRFVKLPSKYDVHEWSIMEEFSLSVQSERVRRDLLDAIHGAGAFRNFKSTLRRHQIEEAWFAFRTEALTEIARDWCEEHHLAWR